MFEAQQEKESSGSFGMWIGIAVILVVAAALAYYVMGSKNGTKTASASLASTNTITVKSPEDLRIVNVKMDKDITGNVAVWSVDLRNMSHNYTYKDINYQTTYLGADNSVIAQNTGKLSLSLDPGDEQSTQFKDLLYPSGTAVFKFNVTSVSASQ